MLTSFAEEWFLLVFAQMANTKLLARLIDEGVPEWNRWRSENLLTAIDLSGADLSAVDLSGADLAGAYLGTANLESTQLIKANLFGTYLRRAQLGGADLGGANLRGADLTGADLTGANLAAADLSGTDLGGADLSGAHLTRANLSGAHLWKSNLSGADLAEADLNGARIYETVFGNSNLSNTKGLDRCGYLGPSTLDVRTLEQSGQLPPAFLRGCGLPETLIEYLLSILNQAMQFYSCFISYSHEDKPFARRLHDGLQGRGIRCWLDEKQLLPGDDIHEGIDRGIRLWDKVLLCCSEHSLTSWWVDAEIDKAFQKEQALMKERKTKTLALIPLNLDGYLFQGWANGKASQVRSRLAPDFRGWQTSHTRCEEQIEQVVRALRADENAREKPPKSLL